MSVKSVPGCLVAIAPSLIGAPVAFLPLPRPHFDADALSPPDAGVPCDALLAGAELEPEPPLELDPPQAATVKATATSTAGRTERAPAHLRSMRMTPPPSDGFTVVPPGRSPARRARAAACRRPAGRASPAPRRGSRHGRAARRPPAGG